MRCAASNTTQSLRTGEGEAAGKRRKSPPAPGEYAPYFREVETRQFELRGASFTLVLGRGFEYAPYRDKVLSTVREKYYALPRWLPQHACYFCDRYFPGAPCSRP